MLGFVVFLFACSSSPKTTEKKETFSFVCPEKWNASDQSVDLYNEFHCEPDGWGSSGLFILQTFTDTLTPINLMHQTYIAAFEENMLMQDFSMTKGSAHSFGSFSGVRSTYTGHLLGMKNEGEIYTFQACERMMVVVKQYALEDKNKYLAGFSEIEKSIICN